MMKQIVSLMIILVPSLLKAQAPDWNVSPQDFSNSMVMVGVLNLNEVEDSNESDLLAAFVDGELRGVASPVFEEEIGKNLIFMIIYGDVDGQALTFQVYDSQTDQVIDLANREVFIINGIKGTAAQPVVWSERVLQTEAELLSFSVPGQLSLSQGDGGITVTFPDRLDVSNVIPEFVVSEGASVLLSGEVQESGLSTVDLSQPLIYQILSEDQQTINKVIVNPVFVTVATTEEEHNSIGSIYPNPVIDLLNFRLRSELYDEILISISDINGKEVRRDLFERQILQNEPSIDLTSLEAGIYFVSFYHERELVKFSKLIKK
ncbi:MAG: T9SS type A sorting domain-containing protein [Bacteroidota bacterium]